MNGPGVKRRDGCVLLQLTRSYGAFSLYQMSGPGCVWWRFGKYELAMAKNEKIFGMDPNFRGSNLHGHVTLVEVRQVQL